MFRGLLLGVLALTVSCGARSGLFLGDEPRGSAGQGGQSGRNGNAGNSGTGRGGGPFTSGGGSAPIPNGGRGPGCFLPPGKCRLPTEVECASSNPVCDGGLRQHAEFFAENVRVNALAAAQDGRVAVGGWFEARLDLGGQVLVSETTGSSFLAVFDADARLLWARTVTSPPQYEVSSLSFMSDGELVARGSKYYYADGESSQFTARYDRQGVERWRRVFGKPEGTLIGVAAAPDADAWLGGTFSGVLELDGRKLTHEGAAGYLLRLDPAGKLRDAFLVSPERCSTSALAQFESDSDGRAVLTGACFSAGNVQSNFLQRLSLQGDTLLDRRFRGTFSFGFGQLALAVDSADNITIGSAFSHSFDDDEGVTHLASDLGTPGGIFLARYAPTGERSWLEIFPSSFLSTGVYSLSADPFGDVAMLGVCGELVFAGMPGSPAGGGACVLKFRDRTPIWAHRIGISVVMQTMVADASANIWLGGYFNDQVEYRGQLIPGNGTNAGVILRLTP